MAIRNGATAPKPKDDNVAALMRELIADRDRLTRQRDEARTERDASYSENRRILNEANDRLDDILWRAGLRWRPSVVFVAGVVVGVVLLGVVTLATT